jgi:hypothetical protein
MRKPCPHNVLLPRGLKCDRGYLVLRVKQDGRWAPCRGLGPHTSSNEKAARLVLEDIRLKQKLGTFSIPSRTKRIKFKDARAIFLKRHFIDYRDPATNQSRSPQSIITTTSHLGTLGLYFDEIYLDAIQVPLLKLWRQKRLEYDGVAGSTINRQLAMMSSLINMFKTWVESDEVAPVKLPVDKEGKFSNPCLFLPDMQEKPRKLPLNTFEELLDAVKRLKQACRELHDMPMWTVINTALESSLRLDDLRNLGEAAREGDALVLEQGKTGREIRLPGDMEAAIDWKSTFTNFRNRFDDIRMAAGMPWLWFRDLRKISLQLLQEQFTDRQLADKAGHEDESVTRKWYLANRQAEKMRPMIEATRRLLEGL